MSVKIDNLLDINEHAQLKSNKGMRSRQLAMNITVIPCLREFLKKAESHRITDGHTITRGKLESSF